MMRGMRRGLAAALIVSLVATATAWADETITTIPPNQFSAAVTTIDQGEKVTLRNNDVDSHDVTSVRTGDDGRPLFRSDLVSPGQSGPVRGTEYLTTGTYPFICSIHPWMEATLEVSSAGAPVPRPEPEPEPASELKLRIATKKLRPVVRKGKLRVRVASSDGTVRLKGRAKSGRRKVAFRRRTVRFDEQGARRVVLRLSKKGRKALRGRKRVKVAVTAIADAAGGETAKTKATRVLR